MKLFILSCPSLIRGGFREGEGAHSSFLHFHPFFLGYVVTGVGGKGSETQWWGAIQNIGDIQEIN